MTVLRWLKRYLAEGIEGLKDAPRPGRSTTVTETYRKRLLEVVRKRPRSLGLEYSMWTLRRLTDYLAEEAGLRVSNGLELTCLGSALILDVSRAFYTENNRGKLQPQYYIMGWLPK